MDIKTHKEVEKTIYGIIRDKEMENKKMKKETVNIVSWRSNLHVACLILNSNQNAKVKDWAYKEIMKAGDILDKSWQKQKRGEQLTFNF